MRYSLIFILSLFMFLIACEDEFSFRTFDDPTASFQFIDADSIYQLELINEYSEDSIRILEQSQDALDSSLLAISDSIDAIDIAIDSGNSSFNGIREILTSRFTQDSSSLISVFNLISDYESLVDSLTIIQNSLGEGFLLLDYVKPQFGVDVTETYTDSTDTYELALNITDSISTYLIGISSEEYSLSLSHKNSEIITADLSVKISFDEIAVYQTTFDSVSICSTSNCPNSGTTIICYY